MNSEVEDMVKVLNLLLSEWRHPCSSFSEFLGFELQCLRHYFYCCLLWNDHSLEPNHLFLIQDALKRAANSNGDGDGEKGLLEKIQQLKPKIQADCLNFLYSTTFLQGGNFHCYSKLSTYVRSITDVLVWKANDDDDLKLQIESLKDNLDFIAQVFDFEEEWCWSADEFRIFKIQYEALARRAVCLSLVNWTIDVNKENMVERMSIILSDLHKESCRFADPEVIFVYLARLTKLSKPLLPSSQIVHKFVAFLLNNLQIDSESDGSQMLFIDLIFFITFLMDRKVEGESILTRVNNLVSEVVPLIRALTSEEIKEEKKTYFLLHNFLDKASAVKGEVRKIFSPLFPSTESFNFSGINVFRRIDSVLEILKGFTLSFPKLPVLMLQDELSSLIESNLEYFYSQEMQNKHKVIKYLWTRIVNLIYNAERAANSLAHMSFLWHDLLHFSDVMEEFKIIKGEMKRIVNQLIMYDIHATNSVKTPQTFLPSQTNVPMADMVVGFKNEIKVIQDRTTGGSTELDIVSIFGMAGLEDEEIRVKNLMLLWISEGFIHKHVNKSIEVVANEYFMDLVDRSLVIPMKRSSTGKIRTCSVHDLLREFCFIKGEKENIFSKVFPENEVSHNPHYRMCIRNYCWRSFLEQGSSAPFVHSLLHLYDCTFRIEVLEQKHINCLASNFRFLQVLCLCSNVQVHCFYEGMTELGLLKCLMLTINACCVIPPSIKKLQNLETLSLELQSSNIPLMNILEMRKLRHLCLRGKSTVTGFYNDTMPPLETLRTFSCIDLDLPYERLEMLFRKITNVENLKFQIKRPKFLKDSNPILKLDFLSHLESLTIHEVETGYLSSGFELYFPSTLKKLHLCDFILLPRSLVSAFSILPNLEVLKLDGCSFEKTWNVRDDQFQNLKFLGVRDLKIEELNASDNSFPRLEHFVVKCCNFLKEIPWRFASIPTLKTIEVDSRHLKCSAREIQDEQKELGNELLLHES